MKQAVTKEPDISPAAAAVWAHCRRTTAVAKLIAHQLFLPPEEQGLLRAACLLHHHASGTFSRQALERLLIDLLGESVPPVLENYLAPPDVRRVLTAFDTPGYGTTTEARLGNILRLANAFDQSMEAQSIYGDDIAEILEQLRQGAEAGLWSKESLNALLQATQPPALGPAASWRVPVFPQAAIRTLNLMRDPRASLGDVAKAASLDPSTSGLLLRLANSALFGSRIPISTLSQAVARLGFDTSQKVIISAALGPVFASPKLHGLWLHSLRVADLSEQLARHVSTVDPGEAYLAGLLHDVGLIALLSLPLYDSARLHGLRLGGCPEIYAEKLLLRTDHPTLGAEIVAGWRLPEIMVSAIRDHHHPETVDNVLADLLYLAEFLSGSEEDLPSRIRLDTSLAGSGLSWNDLEGCRSSELASWLAAA